jgi:4-hydroxy-tetrahydrodipicolinate reductase
MVHGIFLEKICFGNFHVEDDQPSQITTINTDQRTAVASCHHILIHFVHHPKPSTMISTAVIFLGLTALSNGFALNQSPQCRTTSATCLQMSADSFDSSALRVMVNGMPGPMATAAAEACLRKGLSLSPVAMTGPDIEPATITVYDSVTDTSSNVRLIPATDEGREEIVSSLAGLREASGEKNICVIDYTHPSAVNSNAIFYAENKLPFVMGTTGGDRDQLMKDMESRSAFAVIAPNMGKQIVAMQAGLEDLAIKFPSAFAGYKLEVTESHQKKKADTSGTAKAVIGSLKKLSDDGFDVEKDIEMLRDDESSLAFGVPKEAIDGHAFHTYTLTSPDGSVQFQLKHNVSGRTIYAEGTADAIKFLMSKVHAGGDGTVYSMIDVLKAGALE